MAMIKTDNFTQNENIDLTKEISLVAPIDTPLLTMLMEKGRYSKAISKTINWREKTLDDTDASAVEGADASVFVNSTRAEKMNIQELFIKNVAISGSAVASEVVGIADLMAEEVEDRLRELKVQMEKSLTNGVLADGSKTPFKRKMKGLVNFVPTKNKVTGEQLTEQLFKDTVKKLWENGLGSNEFYALVNADLKEQIDTFYEGKYNYVAQTNEFGLVVTKIHTNYGTVNLILDRHMNVDELVIFDAEFLEVSFLREPQFEALGKTGDSEKGMVVSEVSLKVLNEQAVSLFTVKGE